jgi:hypothetical protein
MANISNFTNHANGTGDDIHKPVDKLEQMHQQNIQILYKSGYTHKEVMEIIRPRSMDYKTKLKFIE